MQAHTAATVVRKGSRIHIMQVLFVLAFPTNNRLELGMCTGDQDAPKARLRDMVDNGRCRSDRPRLGTPPE